MNSMANAVTVMVAAMSMVAGVWIGKLTWDGSIWALHTALRMGRRRLDTGKKAPGQLVPAARFAEMRRMA